MHTYSYKGSIQGFKNFKHLLLAFVTCICYLHLLPAFVTCICYLLVTCICYLHMLLSFFTCICYLHLLLVFVTCISNMDNLLPLPLPLLFQILHRKRLVHHMFMYSLISHQIIPYAESYKYSASTSIEMPLFSSTSDQAPAHRKQGIAH